MAAEASVLDAGGAAVSLPTCPFQVPHPQASLWWVDLGCWQLQDRGTAKGPNQGQTPTEVPPAANGVWARRDVWREPSESELCLTPDPGFEPKWAEMQAPA